MDTKTRVNIKWRNSVSSCPLCEGHSMYQAIDEDKLFRLAKQYLSPNGD